MFEIVIICFVKHLALAEEVKGLVELELIFCNKSLDIDLKLIFLTFGNVLETLIVSLMVRDEVLFGGTFCKCFGLCTGCLLSL